MNLKDTNIDISIPRDMFCPLCSKIIPIDFIFEDFSKIKCPSCDKLIYSVWQINAHQAKISRLCNKCGNNTSTKAIFCVKCGSKINSLSILHNPPNDREYNIVQKHTRNVLALSFISLTIFIIGLFPIFMTFAHDRYWLVFIGYFPYNLYALVFGTIGILFGYLSIETTRGKIGVGLNALYLFVSVVYMIYNLWIFFSAPATF